MASRQSNYKKTEITPQVVLVRHSSFKTPVTHFPPSLSHKHSPVAGLSTTANRHEIKNFTSLRENLEHKLNLKNWFHLTSLQNLHIFNVDMKANGNLSIRTTIHINIELTLKVYGPNDDNVIFTVKLYHWPQLQSLIERFGCNVKREQNVTDDETFQSDDDECGIGQMSQAVAFEFCARNDVKSNVSAATKVRAFREFFFNSKWTVQRLTKIIKTETATSDNLQSRSSYSCTKCGKTFSFKARLILHQRMHENHFCSICNETCVGNAEHHRSQRHPDDGQSFECYICRQKYLQLEGLKRHMHSMHVVKRKRRAPKVVNGTRVTCTICEKEFASKDSLKSHIYRFHNKRTLKECVICNRTYDNLKRHMQHVHSEEGQTKNHICHICGATYKQSSGLTKHMETKHSEDGEFFCHICNNGKNYRSKWYLKKHFAIVHAYVEQTGREYSNAFECHLCNERLPSSHTLRQHVRLKHDGVGETETRLQREMCDKYFGSEKSLHNQTPEYTNVQTGETYVCPECGQPFIHQSHLKVHLNQHKGQKENKKSATKKVCSMCDKSYVAITDLRLHMMKIHGTILPIKE